MLLAYKSSMVSHDRNCASACDAGIYDPEFGIYRVFLFLQYFNIKLMHFANREAVIC